MGWRLPCVRGNPRFQSKDGTRERGACVSSVESVAGPREHKAWNLRQRQTLGKNKTQITGGRVLAAAGQKAGGKGGEGTEGTEDVRCP